MRYAYRINPAYHTPSVHYAKFLICTLTEFSCFMRQWLLQWQCHTQVRYSTTWHFSDRSTLFVLLTRVALIVMMHMHCLSRNIKDFMIQTGDPTGTGKGGTSIWGRKFEDEFHETLKVRLKHLYISPSTRVQASGCVYSFLLCHSTTRVELWAWPTVVQTPMALSFSSSTLSSPTLTWSTPS